MAVKHKKKMKIAFLLLFTFLSLSSQKSQDYARHLELSFLFYEAQRSGPLPETNRIYWRHDSLLDAGSDVGLDLSGGYLDAGDNAKFNYPLTSTLTLIAWSGIEFESAAKTKHTGYLSAQFNAILKVS